MSDTDDNYSVHNTTDDDNDNDVAPISKIRNDNAKKTGHVSSLNIRDTLMTGDDADIDKEYESPSENDTDAADYTDDDEKEVVWDDEEDDYTAVAKRGANKSSAVDDADADADADDDADNEVDDDADDDAVDVSYQGNARVMRNDPSWSRTNEHNTIDNYDAKTVAKQGGGATKKNKPSAATAPDDEKQQDDADGAYSDTDDDDAESIGGIRNSYLQKFETDITKTYITNYHPECFAINSDEVEKLSIVVRNNENMIIDPLHKTLPILTKYERARVLGQRAKQIETGAKPLVNVPEHVIDGYAIAELELKHKKIPFIIKRPLPHGGFEYWKLNDLENIGF